MEIKLNKVDNEKLNKLLEVNDNNLNLSDLLTFYFENLARGINKKDIEAITKLNHFSKKDGFFYLLLNILNLDSQDRDTLLLAKSYLYQNIYQLNINRYQNNPYLRKIAFNKASNKEIKLINDCYLPYEGFPLFDVFVEEDNYFKENYSIGFFEEKYNFQAITHSNTTWMSIIPNEIETMKDDIEIVKGNVLVYGLGLGYFAYMVSLKSDVNKITIVEKDSKIIDLFNRIILPQFENKNKIILVNEDAFSFEKNCKEQFDYAYVDLYHGSNDGIEIYLKFKQLELRSQNYLYWLENSLINVIRRNLITIIFEHVNNMNCSYTASSNFNDQIINNLYDIIKDKTFSSYQEIHNLLTSENIKKIVKLHKLF